ncbi:MAG: hypothetical protein KUL82_01125 [Bdellovibrio sp.]|uniref:hypothetical protein n=1 Tax=Bdellovibrio sp. TaxID=28201 RepID=UPI0039E3D30D|nr:hypothetical protein [Bdellovibrio sp.]
MSSKIHYRLCHRCGTANCAEDDLVTACDCCGKHLAPFYFFDESKAMGLDNSNFYSSERHSEAHESLLPHKEYPPVWGLTAYWES